MKTKSFLMLFSAVLFITCKKENNIDPLPTPSEFKDLVVNENFKWNTTRNFTLKFKGVNTQMPEAGGMLTIRMMPEGEEILKIHHKMRTDRDIQLTLPTHVKTIRVLYGIVEKDIQVKATSAEFTPLPEIGNEE